MKTLMLIIIISMCLTSSLAMARGGFSSSGRGSFSSGRSYSPSRSMNSPSRSYSGATRSYAAPSRSVTTTTTTRSSSMGGRGGYNYGHPMMYGSMGMGYGYSNGIITGMILGNLMHPTGTTVYSGGGYSGNALLYPDGRVVNQQGYQVGSYTNGQFVAQDGGMVAQPAPEAPAIPVVVEPSYSAAEIISGIVIFFIIIFIIGVLIT